MTPAQYIKHFFLIFLKFYLIIIQRVFFWIWKLIGYFVQKLLEYFKHFKVEVDLKLFYFYQIDMTKESDSKTGR